MKATFTIDATLLRQLKEEAESRRTTVSALAEESIRRWLADCASPNDLSQGLPRFRSEVLVDLADRDKLYEAMEEV